MLTPVEIARQAPFNKNDNLVINPDGAIYQRGIDITTTGTDEFTIDRWLATNTGARIRTAYDAGAEPGSSINFRRNGTTGTYNRMMTRLEVDPALLDERFTLSFKYWATTWDVAVAGSAFTLAVRYGPDGTWNFVGGPFDGLNAWHEYEKEFNIINDSTASIPYIELAFYGNSTDGTNDFDLYFKNIKLEVGKVKTAYTPRPFAEELVLCQRYFEKTYDVGTKPGTATSVGGENVYWYNSFHAYKTGLRFKVTKRGLPTITFYSAQNGTSGVLSQYASNSAFVSDAAILMQDRSNGGFSLYGNNLALVNQYTRVHYTADAEL